MPFLILLMTAATLALVASSANASTQPPRPPPGPPRPPLPSMMLDPTLPAALQGQVEAALAMENDPAKLEAFAAALAASYPYATWYLRTKAAALRQIGHGAPEPVLHAPTGAAPAPGRDGLDGNLPPELRFNVVELLMQGNDPAVLESFASQLAPNYPLAASALRLRAGFLRQGATGRPAAPGFGAAPVTPPLAPPAGPPGASPPPQAWPATPGHTAPQAAPPAGSVFPGLDVGMPLDLGMRVASALITENDPAKLRALASELQASYPQAASLLFAKANALTLPVAAPMPTAPPAAPPPFVGPPAPQVPVTPAAAGAPTSSPGVSLPAGVGFFDAGMPPELAQRVMTALTTESDPNVLRQLADSIASQYPKAALLLTNKADAIQTLLIAATPPVLPTMTPTPPMMTTRSRTYTVKKGDFPIKIAKLHGQPERAWKELVAANPQKATAPDGNFKSLQPGEVLNIPDTWLPLGAQGMTPQIVRPAPSAPTLTAPAPSAPPIGPLSIPLGSPVLDSNIPANVASAVVTALTSETDAAKLRGFASSISATYPIAAGVLLAKANALALLPASMRLPSLTPTAPNSPRAPSLPSSPSAPTGSGTYKVLSGDSPWKIAQKLTGNGAKWPELVKANPQKPTSADGNFKNLQPGDVLQIPASWSDPAVRNGAPAGTALARGGSHAPSA